MLIHWIDIGARAGAQATETDAMVPSPQGSREEKEHGLNQDAA